MIVFKLAELATTKYIDATPTKVHYATSVSYPTVLRLWNNDAGINKIALETIEIFCDYLDCEPGDLIKRVNP